MIAFRVWQRKGGGQSDTPDAPVSTSVPFFFFFFFCARLLAKPSSPADDGSHPRLRLFPRRPVVTQTQGSPSTLTSPRSSRRSRANLHHHSTTGSDGASSGRRRAFRPSGTNHSYHQPHAIPRPSMPGEDAAPGALIAYWKAMFEREASMRRDANVRAGRLEKRVRRLLGLGPCRREGWVGGGGGGGIVFTGALSCR